MLLTNHAYVLFFLDEQSDATLREIGDRIGVTERAAHRIVNELVQVGALRRERIGRRNRYEVLRECVIDDGPIPSGESVAALLDVAREQHRASGCS